MIKHREALEDYAFSDYFDDWFHEAGDEAGRREVARRVWDMVEEHGVIGDDPMWMGGVEPVPARLLLEEAAARGAGEYLGEARFNLIYQAACERPRELLLRSLEDAGFAEAAPPDYIFYQWADIDPARAKEWFLGLAADDPARGRLADEALQRGFHHGVEDAAALLAGLPPDSQHDTAWVLAVHGAPEGGLADRIRWLERWREELGPKEFKSAFNEQIQVHEEAEDEADFRAAAALAEGMGCSEFFNRCMVVGQPGHAVPWVAETVPAGERRSSLLARGFDRWITSDSDAALEFAARLRDPADLAAFEKGVERAWRPPEVVRARANALLEELRR